MDGQIGQAKIRTVFEKDWGKNYVHFYSIQNDRPLWVQSRPNSDGQFDLSIKIGRLIRSVYFRSTVFSGPKPFWVL